MSAIRTRWAAIGAAVAVSLGAGGLGVVQAVVDDGPKPVFVPINPCRILDTRDYGGFNVGPRDTPIGADQTYEVQAAGGTNGECSDVPTSAVGLVMNVTLTDATMGTHVSVWPSDEAQPNASNLNTTVGATAVPNLVTTDLSADGKFSLYNFQGTVNVLADVVGYYDDHNHDDRYYTETEVDDLLSQYLTETEINQLIEDATLGDVDLSDYLTETEINTLIEDFLGDYYTQAEVDALIADFLTEAEINALIATVLVDYYTAAEVDALIADFITEAEGDVRYVNEADLAGQTRTGDLPTLALLASDTVDVDTLVTDFGAGITYEPTTDQFTAVDEGTYRVSYRVTSTAALLSVETEILVNGTPPTGLDPVSLAGVGSSSDTVLLDIPAGGTVELEVTALASLTLGDGSVTFTIERAA